MLVWVWVRARVFGVGVGARVLVCMSVRIRIRVRMRVQVCCVMHSCIGGEAKTWFSQTWIPGLQMALSQRTDQSLLGALGLFKWHTCHARGSRESKLLNYHGKKI